MSLPSPEIPDLYPGRMYQRTTQVIRECKLDQTELLNLIGLLNPSLKNLIDKELQNSQAATYYQEQNMLELIASGQLFDHLVDHRVSLARLGTTDQSREPVISNIRVFQPRKQKREMLNGNAHSPPPRLA